MNLSIGLLIGIVALLAALLGLRWFAGADPARLALVIRKGSAGLALVAATAMALTGRFMLALMLGGLAWALWTGRLPFRSSFRGGASGPSANRTTSVRTAFLEMTLDHDSRAVQGRVLAGLHAGRDLASLSRPELTVLLGECRAGEAQSRQVLEAYLDRAWPEWRDDMRRDQGAEQAGAKGRSRQTGAAASPAGAMPRAEALQVLGLPLAASDDDIRAAHRNLMKRLHPDQGGSTYLAAKINEAKDVLLAR